MDSESKLQTDCYVWFHNTYPKLRGLLCYNLNNSRNKIDGAKNKALGLIAGRSDMVLYRDGVATMIEFKIRDGVQSELQKEWQKIIEKENFEYYIIRDLDSFINLIRSKI
jgi:hypothetical protein